MSRMAAALGGLALWACAAQGAGAQGQPAAPPACPSVIQRQTTPPAGWSLLSDNAEENLVLTARVIHRGQFGCGYAPAAPGSVEAGQPFPLPPGGAPVQILLSPAAGAPRCQAADDGSDWTPQLPTAVCLLKGSPCQVTCVQ